MQEGYSICFNEWALDSDIKNDDGNEYVDFEIFANFYEYVSFIYPNDRDFEYIVKSTWI